MFDLCKYKKKSLDTHTKGYKILVGHGMLPYRSFIRHVASNKYVKKSAKNALLII